MDWIVRFIRFHRMRAREDLFPGEAKIEAFLSHLATAQNVAPATQNQAMNALVFLYKRVLDQPLNESIDAIRAERKENAPVVLTREEVVAVLPRLEGTAQLVVKLLYGSGLRIMEAVRLRVKDLDFQMKQVTVRSGKGDRDRLTTFPASLTPLLQNHLATVRAVHQRDLAQGGGEVYLPHALARKYPSAGKEWGWQYVFPARELSVDPRSGRTRRHHVDPSGTSNIEHRILNRGPTPNPSQEGTIRAHAVFFSLPAQRRGITDIAFVELDIFLGEIGAINYGAGLAEIQVDVQVEFLGRDGGAEVFEAGFGRLTTLEAPENFPVARRAVTDVHLFLDDFGAGITERIDDATPIRITAVPARLHQRAVGYGARGGVGIGEIPRAIHSNRDKTRCAFAVAHDHFGQFEADVIESGLENRES